MNERNARELVRTLDILIEARINQNIYEMLDQTTMAFKYKRIAIDAKDTLQKLLETNTNKHIKEGR